MITSNATEVTAARGQFLCIAFAFQAKNLTLNVHPYITRFRMVREVIYIVNSNAIVDSSNQTFGLQHQVLLNTYKILL